LGGEFHSRQPLDHERPPKLLKKRKRKRGERRKKAGREQEGPG